MARELDDWLVQGVECMVDGSYTARHLKRHYFPDEMVDQLHLADRIFQNILFKQLKPTFPYVMNPNCYHMHGPSGVRFAMQRIRQILLDQTPKYIIRADIKSFYKSIPHHQLVLDIKQYYYSDNTKVIQANGRKVTKINPVHNPTSLDGRQMKQLIIKRLRWLHHRASKDRRKAREQIKAMVIDDLSARRIKSYLHQWVLWWVRTSNSWSYHGLLEWFLHVCWDVTPAAYAAWLLQQSVKNSCQGHARALQATGFHANA